MEIIQRVPLGNLSREFNRRDFDNGESAFYRKLIIDIKTGKRTFSKPLYFKGTPLSMMPNAHPSSMKTQQQLQSQLTPVDASGNTAVERIPWIWYHAQTYTSASTTQLIFFQTTGAIATTNMQQAGVIPSPQYYDVYHIGFYWQMPVSNVAVVASNTPAGAANDLIALVNSVATFTIAQKEYYKAHMWLLPPGAGIRSIIAIAGTYSSVDGDQQQQATLGIPDLRNRSSFWGDITIPHQQNFALQVDWASAVTIGGGGGNPVVVAYLDGYLYRRAL